jgi:hypothetical protein
MDPNQPTPKLPIRLQRAMAENTGLRLSRAEVRNVARLEQIAVASEELLVYLDRDLSEDEYGEGQTMLLNLIKLLNQHRKAFDA